MPSLVLLAWDGTGASTLPGFQVLSMVWVHRMDRALCYNPVGFEVVTPMTPSHIQPVFALQTLGIRYLTSKLCKTIRYRSNLHITKINIFSTL